MTLRGFRIAIQFLTRIPMPRVADYREADLTDSAVWFPLTGVLIGAIVVLAFLAGSMVSPWIAALAAMLAWMIVTGGLHLDGLADVSDALAAAHRAPERFLEVVRDPLVGAFGVMAIAAQLISKLVLIAHVPRALAIALLLVPAWSRWGPLVWSSTIPPLAKGTGERFGWHISRNAILVQGALLALASALLSPVLLVAFPAIAAIALYWRYRLGGITGDCLGASVEVTETILLLGLVVSGAMHAAQ